MDIAVGALLGLAYIAAPGPINVETLRRGLAGGTRAALALQFGACLGHLTYAALALLGLGVLALAAPVHLLLGLAGTGVLTYLGVAAVRDGWRGWAGASAAAHPSGDRLALAEAHGNPRGPRARVQQAPVVRRTLALGAAISLANPFAVAFWLTIGGSVLHQAHRNGVLFLGGFFLSVVVWAVGMPAVLGWGRAAVRGRLFNGVSMVCGGTLIAFGLTLGHALTAAAA
jgi:threonine/homoserine/homoserine lactone efflux protein